VVEEPEQITDTLASLTMSAGVAVLTKTPAAIPYQILAHFSTTIHQQEQQQYEANSNPLDAT
jgi:hypothetical protein